MPIKIVVPRNQDKIIERDLKRAVGKIKGTAIIRATEMLYEATPKDTTNAANNWVPSIRNPSTATHGSKQSPSRSRQLDGIAKIKAWMNKPDNSTIYLTNNVPYIDRLNAGSSRQAPANFVESVVARIKSLVSNMKVQ